MEENYRLRAAAQEEIDAVAALYRAAIGSPGCTWNEWYPTKEEARRDWESDGLFVFTENGRVIGAASIVAEPELDGYDCWKIKEGRPCEIARVVLVPDRRGKGLAVRLLTELFTCLRERGYTAVRLMAAQINQAALHTYRTLGFTFPASCEAYGNRYDLGERSLLP